MLSVLTNYTYQKGNRMLRKFIVAAVLVCSLSANAAERITFMVGFSAASSLANNVRLLCQEMNRVQNKYEFVFESKPGAGGAVAAKEVLQNPKNTIMSGHSTFFLRSNFDKTTGYDINDFQGVFVQATGTPVALYSSKYSSLNEIKPGTKITTAISGYGSHSNLLSSILAESGFEVTIINYVNLIDATKDVLGKHVDTGWNWLSDIEPLAETNKVKILAVIGTRSVNGYPTFASQGIKGFDKVVNSTAVYASKDMAPDRVREIHELLKQANRTTELQTAYTREYGMPLDFSFVETQAWFNQQAKFWANQSAKVKPL
jgi:tripartite-type tricarboxylate transporter receptor subunit TctC